MEVKIISNNRCTEVRVIFNVLYMFPESRAFFKIITHTRKKDIRIVELFINVSLVLPLDY